MRFLHSGYALSFFLILAFSCRPKADAGPEAETVSVTVIIAREAVFHHTINASGRLSPWKELKLSFKTGGIIDSIPIKEGQRVIKGDILALLNLSEIRAGMRQAELMHEKAHRDYERLVNLYSDAAVTLEQLQNAETALRVAESSLTVAKFNLDNSYIRAPANGHVLKILAGEKEIIASGYPALLFAASTDTWLLRVAVNDRDIIHIKNGDHAAITFDPYPEMVFSAKVHEIAAMADPYTGVFEVGIALHSPEKNLMTGFIGKATIVSSKADNYMVIPPETIVEANRREGVIFKCVNGYAVRTNITIEDIKEDLLLVTGDLADGDSIIMEGARFIRDGQRLIPFQVR
jgi:membrane fusion protein, multidrug efflux system